MSKKRERPEPFNHAYYLNEIRSFPIRTGRLKSVEIHKFSLPAGYNHLYMREDIIKEISGIPELKIDGHTWMTLNPLELESHYIPIRLAKGRVGVGGLGIGYYVQRILHKPEVTHIDVYEINPDIIAMYQENFGEHEKLNIHQIDLREVYGQTWEFFYCDIYRQLEDPKAISDMVLLNKNNDIQDYHFWTQESVYFKLLEYYVYLPKAWTEKYKSFILDMVKSGGRFDYMAIDDVTTHLLDELKKYDLFKME